MNSVIPLPVILPRHMTLEVTTECNYYCPFCYCLWHEFPGQTGSLLSTDQWKNLIDQCIRKGVESILFTGGEALLRPDICDLLDYAAQKKPEVRLSLFTNGALMDEKTFFFCKKRRILLSTSLQGLTTYNEMTGTETGYHNVLQLLALERQEKWPVDVSIVVTGKNIFESQFQKFWILIVDNLFFRVSKPL